MALHRPGDKQNGCQFPDHIFKCIFLTEKIITSIEIPLKFVPKVPINNIPSLVQIMAWRRPGDKPLSETMMVGLLTHICVTRPQWVNGFMWLFSYILRECFLIIVWLSYETFKIVHHKPCSSILGHMKNIITSKRAVSNRNKEKLHGLMFQRKSICLLLVCPKPAGKQAPSAWWHDDMENAFCIH